MGYQVGSLAFAIFTVAAVLLAANFGYGLIHETAHAIAVKALGGEAFKICVNPLGLDAYMEHSPVSGAGFIVLELAGLGATTIVAMSLAIAGKEVVPALFALRTAIYALNYAPGTDIADVYATIGNVTFTITVIVVLVNLLVLSLALRRRVAPITGLFASLSRGRPRHNNGE